MHALLAQTNSPEVGGFRPHVKAWLTGHMGSSVSTFLVLGALILTVLLFFGALNSSNDRLALRLAALTVGALFTFGTEVGVTHVDWIAIAIWAGAVAIVVELPKLFARAGERDLA